MGDLRCKNANWNIHAAPDGTVSYEKAHLAVLMDIRDELQTLNLLLGCRNFTDIPNVLRKIRTNTAKPRKPK